MSLEHDRFKPIVKLLSLTPSIILLVLVLSLLLYLVMPTIRSIQLYGVYHALGDRIAKLILTVYYSYFPSQLNPFNIACLVALTIFLLCIMSPLRLGYSFAIAYATGVILYFGGTVVSGFMLGIASLTGGTSPIMPYYGFGIGDLFLAGFLFLLSMSGKVVSLVWRWASSQLPALLAVILAVNMLALTSMWLDKKQSKTEGFSRVPEKAFLRYAVLGGGAGVLLGAFLFRHKTKHRGLITSVIIASAAGIFILLGGLIA
ncbi:MAG: DUF1294 domain-containing protein [Thaumarchaeota archaeon]|jgi:uncharacterized membrane protein YsdA (DUF1294 family)|nr:DUF1294 domain-containing protein [Candidatus Geocrenenecus arthurdayi]